MGTRLDSRSLLLLVFLVSSLLIDGVASADTLTVTIGTEVLSGTTGTLAFDFIDGDGLIDNVLSVSSFTSDATLESGVTAGSVSGGLPGVVTFSDTHFFNELLVPSTLGASIVFTIDYTNVAGSLPDTLAFFLLDSAALNSLVTTDLPGDALLVVSMTGDPTLSVTLASAVEPAVTIVPEPSSPAWLALGLLIISAPMTRNRSRIHDFDHTA
jgi:hypothetical protein